MNRTKLNRTHLHRFAGETLFDRVARAVCEAECLPKKELYESWEVARRVRRRFRGGRVLDLACGHGLVAWLMLVLDDTSKEAVAVDVRIPDSAAKIARTLTATWPRLEGRITLREGAVDQAEATKDDVIVSAHACGALTDRVLDVAIRARARVAVLPCCHDEATCDAGGLDGWMDAALAVDATRAARLRGEGYRVHTQLIPRNVTPKNRLLCASPH